jgi:NAD-dependent DNA ligase
MVDCPECGKPLKRSKHKSKYCCENSACSVIFVRHPDEQSLMEITYKASARRNLIKKI